VPFAGDKLKDNLHPLGRVFYAASTLLGVPNSMAAEGMALGVQAGEGRLRKVSLDGGLHPLPSRGRDAVQPGARSSPLIATANLDTLTATGERVEVVRVPRSSAKGRGDRC